MWLWEVFCTYFNSNLLGEVFQVSSNKRLQAFPCNCFAKFPREVSVSNKPVHLLRIYIAPSWSVRTRNDNSGGPHIFVKEQTGSKFVTLTVTIILTPNILLLYCSNTCPSCDSNWNGTVYSLGGNMLSALRCQYFHVQVIPNLIFYIYVNVADYLLFFNHTDYQ